MQGMSNAWAGMKVDANEGTNVFSTCLVVTALLDCLTYSSFRSPHRGMPTTQLIMRGHLRSGTQYYYAGLQHSIVPNSVVLIQYKYARPDLSIPKAEPYIYRMCLAWSV